MASFGNYTPAEPGALGIGPLEAATLDPKLYLFGRRTKHSLPKSFHYLRNGLGSSKLRAKIEGGVDVSGHRFDEFGAIFPGDVGADHASPFEKGRRVLSDGACLTVSLLCLLKAVFANSQ